MSTIADTKQENDQVGLESVLSTVTVEWALYALSLGVAVVLRLASLERWPLLEGEAALALAAWRFARGVPAILRGYSPLLFHLNSLLFFFTEGSDQLARLGPLVVGSLLVLWPLGLRRQLGRVGALTASFMLTISPTLTYFSRSVDGSIIVAFCELGVLVLAARYLEERRPTGVAQFAALLLLALLAAPSAYTIVAALVTFPLFLSGWARFRYAGWWHEARKVRDQLGELGAMLRGSVPLLLVLLLVGGLAFTTNPAGLQMALDQLGQWVGALRFHVGSPWYACLLLLILYEGLPLLLGLTGFVLDQERDSLWSAALRYWFVFMLVTGFLPGGRSASHLLLIAVPLILSGGRAVDRLAQELSAVKERPELWALVTAGLIVAAAVYVQIVNYLSFANPNNLLRMVAMVVFLLSSYALVWSLTGAEVPLRAAIVTFLLLLFLGTIRTETRLNYTQARDPLEPMVGATASPDLLRFEQKAAQLSSQLAGDPRAMAWLVDASLEDPLGWYLRRFEQVRYASSIPSRPEALAIVTPTEGPAPADHVGLRFGLRSPGVSLQRSPQEWLRWWTGYASPAPKAAVEEILMWVPAAPQ